jgi:hypothetical protein
MSASLSASATASASHVNEDAFVLLEPPAGPASFSSASLQLQSTSRDGKSVTADLVGTYSTSRGGPLKVRVKSYLSGSPASVLQHWMERQGRPTIPDLGAYAVLVVLETGREIQQVREEAGFVVVVTSDGSRGAFVSLFDDKYVPVTDNQTRLMMVHPKPSMTRHFTFGPNKLEQVQKIPGVRSAKPQVFDVLEASAQ